MYRFLGVFEFTWQKVAIVTLSLQTNLSDGLYEVKEFADFLAQMAIYYQVKTVEELENVESQKGLIKLLIQELSEKLEGSLLIQDVIVVDVSE